MSTEIHSDVRGHRFSTVPCRGAPVSEAFHKARLCRSAARLSGCWRYAEIRRITEVAKKDDWGLVFEAVSVVDHVLRRDPSGAYAQMDFASRDRQRKAVEEIAQRDGDAAMARSLRGLVEGTNWFCR